MSSDSRGAAKLRICEICRVQLGPTIRVDTESIRGLCGHSSCST